MNLSAISPINHAQPEIQSSASTPAAPQKPSASEAAYTVSLSSAAQKAPAGVDVDHDGDSH